MTFVGKILVVVQVVLSVCFMAFAGAVYTVHDNWKTKAADLQEQVAIGEQQMNSLQEEYDQYKNGMTSQLNSERDRANAAEAQGAGLQQTLAAVRTELDAVKTERDTQRALAAIAGDEAKFRQNEALALRQVNDDLYKSLNAKEAERRSLEDDLFSKEVEVESMVAKQGRLLDELVVLRKVISSNGLDTDPKTYKGQQTPPPVVVGVVENTTTGKRNGADLIQLSIGSDDGLAMGHSVFVYRSRVEEGERPRYLGKVRIIHVTPDKAVGEVINRAKNGIIERGDNVTTKL